METVAAFPVPFAAPQNQSWRDIGASLRNNALAGFSPRAFEELSVARSFAGRQQIITNDPAAIRHVLIENPDNYRRTAATHRLLAPVVGRGLLLATGEDWRTQRRAAAPALAPRMMGRVAEVAGHASDKLVTELAALNGTPGGKPGGKPVDLFGRLQLLALDIAATALFSLDLGEEAPLLRAELQAYADGVGRPTLLDFLLPRGLPSPRWFGRWRFRRRWMAHIGRVIAQRQAEPVRYPPGDLFDMMREAAASDRMVVEQSATMLAAGHETTAVTLFWSLYILAHLPAVQRRIAAEASGLDLGSAGLGPSSATAALAKLPYTRAVVDEALRLYPPAFSIIRQARARDNAAGIAIPARAVVLIVPWVLHRHKKLWRDPDLFVPERFLPGAEPPRRFSYLPFGAGPRACIGAQFALTEAALVVARLVREFEIELADRKPVIPVALITLQPDHRPFFHLRQR